MASGEWVSFLADLPGCISSPASIRGVLARNKFYRAVADEAQFIRNRYVF
jgi:hypothetical protein